MSTLAGRVALVTGASQGIGRAVCAGIGGGGRDRRALRAERAKLAEVAAEIKAAGGVAHPFALDLGSEESIQACAKAVIAQLGKVEILVNNAGITRDTLTCA